MSSWSAAAYPGSRRSRSRSPYRGPYGSRPPYPDSTLPPDPYRTDWEAYDRDRAWNSYDRERAAYDYGRRGRSRSPGDDGPASGRKRRRSASPWDRDRYEPRPRYDDYDPHRGHGGFSPRRGQYPPYPSRHAPPDPHTFDYPATLKQYAEWFRYFYPQQATEEDNADKAAEQEAGDGSKPRNGIRSKWEKYKKEFASHQLQRMFEHHRKSPWFAEKYEPSPEFMSLRMRLRKEGWKDRLKDFLVDLKAGKFDPDFTEPEQEPTSPTKETPTNGAEIPEINLGPAGAEETKSVAVGDEDMQNADVEDEAGENETGRLETNGKGQKDSKHNNRGEEISVMPDGNQVMIRTIPPDIGRLRLEEACGKVPGYVYLALGDPLQKRNYYRAGWLKFQDDADMPLVMSELTDKKIEGFKLHVTHNVKPFTNRVRYAPEVASKPERLVKDLANAKILAGLLEEELERVRRPQQEKSKENVPEGTPIEGVNGSVSQEDTLMSEVGEPPQSTDFEDENEPREKGSVSVERRIEKTLADLRESGTLDVSDTQEFETKRAAISLDLYISYLRAAFNTCFYCAVTTDHVEELQRKCVKHVRKPMSQAMIEEFRAAAAVVEKEDKDKKGNDHIGPTEEGENDEQDISGEKPKEPEEKEKEKDTVGALIGRERGENRDWKRNDERWLDWFDSKIALLINRDGVDPRNYGGKDYEEELSKATEPFIKQEDEGKFRCKTCQKLFKATSFVEKHVANKHPELVRHLEDIPYFNNFALDPHRIQPFTHAPAQIGNSQQPPPQAYGLQGPSYPPPSGDYGRIPPQYYGAYGQGYPPYPPPPGGYWDYYQPHPFGAHPPPPSRRDDPNNARRLSDRISGYANDQSIETSGLPMAAGLPAKPIGVENSTNGRRGRGGSGAGGGPLPPPPPNAKEDPRAAAGKKVSYHDMDLVAEGDVELNY